MFVKYVVDEIRSALPCHCQMYSSRTVVSCSSKLTKYKMLQRNPSLYTNIHMKGA